MHSRINEELKLNTRGTLRHIGIIINIDLRIG